MLAENLVSVDMYFHDFTASDTVLAYRSASPLSQMNDQTNDAEGRAEDIWVLDRARDTATRFTSDPGSDRNPVWAPDGRKIVFSSSRERTWQVCAKSTLTAEGAIPILANIEAEPTGISPDGKYLTVFVYDGIESAETDFWAVPLESDGGPSHWRSVE